MSKRGSSSARIEREKYKLAHLGGAALTELGRTAFKKANYNEAIQLWEQANEKGKVPPTLPNALAEAYFRRAVSGASTNLEDMQKAVQFNPNELRYQYHLALAYHRDSNLTKAEAIYRQLLAKSPPYKRAALLLAQLLVEQRKPLSKDAVWNYLSSTEQVQLSVVEDLLKGKLSLLQPHFANQAVPPLWRGLVALVLGDEATAQQYLQMVVASPNSSPKPFYGLAHYYLGVLAAKANQMEQVQKHFESARQAGLNTPYLSRNIANLAYLQALKEKEANRPEKAAELLNKIESSEAVSEEVFKLQCYLNWHLGYVAAQKQDWKRALTYWQKADSQIAKSRPLMLNLALAYQNVEQYRKSAEHWRELLRHRPRSATHPEAMTDEQVARIWQHVADNYTKVEDYEEAIKTYKNAVKWSPENVDLRFKLIEAYQMEGHWQAAENELNRILEKNPDNIRALTLLGEICGDDYYYSNRAKDIWLRILKLEPLNPIARQQLAYFYAQRAMSAAEWGNPKKALEIYEEGLGHLPDSSQLCVGMGMVKLDFKELDQAREYFARALAQDPDNLSTLFVLYMTWLTHKSAPDVDEIFERIKAITKPIPSGFFIDLIDRCFDIKETARVQEIGKLVEEQYASDNKVLVELASRYLDLNLSDQALVLLRHVLKNDPDHIEANMHIGTLYYKTGQTRLGKQHWQKAETKARKEGDHVLLYELKILKDRLIYGKEPSGNPLDMLKDMPPEVLELFLRDAPPEVKQLIKMYGLEGFISMLGKMGGSMDFDD